MRTRQYEIDAVVATLEQDHPSAEAAAQAVWDTVIEQLRKRDCHAVGLRLDEASELIVGFGPFWDVRSANSFAGRLPGTAATKFLFGPSRLADVEGECHECGHPWLSHLDRGCVMGYDATLPTKTSTGTVRSVGCGCNAVKGQT